MKKKNVLMMALSLCLVAVIAVGGTLAYLSDSDGTLVNTFKFANNIAVDVYEYTPGFIHAKSFVVDGEYATVGTINMDYRSLYLHFECGVWMYKTPCIQQMEEDFMRTLEQSGEVSLDSYRMTWWKQLGRGILRVFAPLM